RCAPTRRTATATRCGAGSPRPSRSPTAPPSRPPALAGGASSHCHVRRGCAMRDRLHPFLLLLTLLDLAFVHATDVVSGATLAPLWVFAAASGRLRRLQRFVTYRVLWNSGVLLVFALLVQHATTTGLLHMLEDGLLLAVLCQVHLLNNVGERQRPDL